MNRLLILSGLVLLVGCSMLKREASQLPVMDVKSLQQLQLPYGNKLLNAPIFDAAPDDWGDSIELLGRVWPREKLDSLLDSQSYHSDSAHVAPSIAADSFELDELQPKAESCLRTALPYLDDLTYSRSLAISRYFVLDRDTVVFLEDMAQHEPHDGAEGTSQLSYMLAATIKDKRPHDYVLLNYSILQLYEEPVRLFYISRDQIRTVDLVLGEVQDLVAHDDYTIHNHQFVKKP